ncbi:MAG: tetratricopeptide repeat protein [Myxococcota bacterium]
MSIRALTDCIELVVQDGGMVFQRRRCPAEAEPLYRRALALTEAALGPDHPSVGTPLNNLA